VCVLPDKRVMLLMSRPTCYLLFVNHQSIFRSVSLSVSVCRWLVCLFVCVFLLVMFVVHSLDVTRVSTDLQLSFIIHAGSNYSNN